MKENETIVGERASDALLANAERIEAAAAWEGNQCRDATKKIGDAAKESEAAGPRAPERAAHGSVALVAPVCAGAGWTERTGETPVPPEARMRKALELLLAQATEYINKGLLQIPWPMENACKEARAALAAMLCNCDINTENIREHYEHARAKHPYFCDLVYPDSCELVYPDRRRQGSFLQIQKELDIVRKRVVRGEKTHSLSWDDLLDCEIWEVYEALAKNDIAQAVEECYDAIAVLLRTIDVLEGRQPLGAEAQRKINSDSSTEAAKHFNSYQQHDA